MGQHLICAIWERSAVWVTATHFGWEGCGIQHHLYEQNQQSKRHCSFRARLCRRGFSVCFKCYWTLFNWVSLAPVDLREIEINQILVSKTQTREDILKAVHGWVNKRWAGTSSPAGSPWPAPPFYTSRGLQRCRKPGKLKIQSGCYKAAWLRHILILHKYPPTNRTGRHMAARPSCQNWSL